MGIRANNPHNDYMIQLIRSALLAEPVPSMPQGCSVQALGALIRRQHLTNLVYPTVSQVSELEPLKMQLERDYLIQIPKVTNQQVEIQKWLDAAEAKGLRCIPMKGFLLRKLYPSPMMRSMTDLDVLIQDMDRQDIRSWMEGMGYTAEETHALSHHDNFEKRPWMYMELHFHLMKPRPGRDELEQKVWAHATPMPGYQHIYQMSLEDFYIFHLLHLHKHFTSRGVGLKSVIDIYVFLKAHGSSLNRQYLAKELKALGIDEFGAYMEKLSNVLLGDTPADKDCKLVADYMADCGSFGSTEHHHIIQMAQTKGDSSFSKRLRYRLKLLFPNVQWMSKRFPSVQRFPWLLPIYWIARIFKQLLKGKKQSRDPVKKISAEHFDAVSHILTITGAQK